MISSKLRISTLEANSYLSTSLRQDPEEHSDFQEWFSLSWPILRLVWNQSQVIDCMESSHGHIHQDENVALTTHSEHNTQIDTFSRILIKTNILYRVGSQCCPVQKSCLKLLSLVATQRHWGKTWLPSSPKFGYHSSPKLVIDCHFNNSLEAFLHTS